MGTPSDADFALVKTVGRITRALNGNPLAIHLIAAHAQALDVGTLDGPVERLFDLTSVRTDQPLRQHSLNDAFDWSLKLLDDDAKRVFHLLAQFPGGISSRILALVAAKLGFEFVRVIALVGELLDRSLVFRANPTARIVVPEAARHYSMKLAETNGTRESLERTFIDIMAQHSRNCEHTFWFSPVAFWRAEFMPEAENVRAAFILAAERRYDEPVAMLGLAVRHAWAEDGLLPTPLGLRDVMLPERLNGARASEEAIYRVFDALSGLHASIWETIQELEARKHGFNDKEHNLWLGLAYLGECTSAANYDLPHAKMCRMRAAEHLPEWEATPIVLQFMLSAKGLVSQASGELDAAQEVF